MIPDFPYGNGSNLIPYWYCICTVFVNNSVTKYGTICLLLLLCFTVLLIRHHFACFSLCTRTNLLISLVMLRLFHTVFPVSVRLPAMPLYGIGTMWKQFKCAYCEYRNQKFKPVYLGLNIISLLIFENCSVSVSLQLDVSRIDFIKE